MQRKQAAKLRAQGYDLDLIYRTQNPGPTIFHSDYIEYGNAVATIVSFYDFPHTPQSQMWLRHVLETKHTISLMKIGQQDRGSIKKAIVSELNGNQAILNDKWQNAEHKVEAAGKLSQTKHDLNETVNGRMNYKKLYFRVMLIATDLTQLRQDLKDFQDKITAYRAQPYSGEMGTHAQQFFVPASKVAGQALKDPGFPMKTWPLAGTYPFNQAFLSDPRGAFIGQTFQRGEVMFDPSFTDGNARLTAFHLVTGDSGSGKSVYLHQQIDQLFARGDIIWTMDSTKRYVPHFEQLDAKILTLDGSQNMTNPLHIFGTVIDDAGQVNATSSFTQNLDRIIRSIRPSTRWHLILN